MKVSGSLAALCVATSLAMPVQAADWVKAESENFIIYSDTSVKDTRAYTAKLENFQELTSAFYDEMSDTVLPTFGKTRFNYFARVEEFKIVKPELDGTGFTPYLPCREGTQYFSTAQADDNNSLYGQGVIDPDIDLNLAYMFFAYNDHVLHERFNTLPGWVKNGLNWYFMTAVFKDSKIMVGKPPPNIAMSMTRYNIENLADRKDIIPFADRIAGKPVPPRLADMQTYEDWVMVSYLMSDIKRRKTFFDYLKKIDSDVDSTEAFQQTVGLDPDVFRGVMKTYSTKGVPYQIYTIDAVPDASVTLTNLPKYGASVPLIDAALQTCPSPELGAKHLTTLRKIAPQFPDDDLAQTALARAEISFGDAKAPLAFLNRQLAADPKNYDAQVLLGRLYLRLAEQGPAESKKQSYGAARRELGKAYTLDPSSAPGLYFYARAFADQPDYPNDNTMKAVELAQDYSGQRYNLYLAELLVRRDRYEEAKAIVDDELTYANDKWARNKVPALLALQIALTAHTPKEDILLLFAQYDSIDPWASK